MPWSADQWGTTSSDGGLTFAVRQRLSPVSFDLLRAEGGNPGTSASPFYGHSSALTATNDGYTGFFGITVNKSTAGREDVAAIPFTAP